MKSITFIGLAVVLAGGLTRAQVAPDVPDAGPNYDEIRVHFESWNASNGGQWHMEWERATGQARTLFGGRTGLPSSHPEVDADYAYLARQALSATFALHGIEDETLVDDSVVFLPLGIAGSTDKLAVRFRQELGSVPVVNGWVYVLLDTEGRLLAVDALAMPRLRGMSTLPSLSRETALDAARARFQADTGLPATEVGRPELVIHQEQGEKLRTPTLAWQVEVGHAGPGAMPEAFRYFVDARDGRVAGREDLVHDFDVSGTVQTMATPGLLPDLPSNPETAQPCAHMTVTSPQGNAQTDANGNFTIVGATAPLQVTVRYNGQFTTTNNSGGTPYSLVQTLNAPTGNQILMNPATGELDTAQANSFVWINKLRDWTRAVNPSDAKADFNATSNCNLAQTCNAFYNGNSVNFFRAGGGCVNTAYSTVVVHEMGHWLNDRYAKGNGPDGFGEGNADVFAMFIADDPIVGNGFCGTGCHVRTGLNTRPFCGDANPGCYGEVHADGEVLMGALWKVRARLKAALGNSMGSARADVLFNGWMNSAAAGQIRNIMVSQYLTLDDDDGNINNGTPNYQHINGGFKDQGFPGFQLTFVSFANVTQLPNTTNAAGPYVVTADIIANLNPPLTDTRLFYSVNASPFSQIPMTHTSGNTYTASIPGQACPSSVRYYLSGTDSGSQTQTHPASAPGSALKFIVGNVTTYFSDTFESGAPGWTHGMLATQDDWQLSSQQGLNISGGKVNDPTTAAVSGTNIWGNDLGPSGFNGAYANNVNNWLRSPVMDLSQATGTTLKFNRWLRVESGQFDQARIRVNGTQVWINPTTGDLLDSLWVPVELDISALADGNPAVQIEWSMQSDGSATFGGWNIDDVELVSIGGCGPPPCTGNVTLYCTGKFNSLGCLPVASSTGVPSATTGSGHVVSCMNVLNNKAGVMLYSISGPLNVPFQGGILCINTPIRRGVPLNAGGNPTGNDCSGTFSMDMNAFAVGALGGNPIPELQVAGTQVWAQFWGRDQGFPPPNNTTLSNGIRWTICQ